MTLFKTLIFLFFTVSLYSQDTICLSKDRLARIADTLTHYKNFKQGFYHCDSLLALNSELISTQGQVVMQKDSQIKVLNNAFMECEQLRAGWERNSSEYKQTLEATERRLHKAKKARKGWMITGLTTIGTTIATTAIIIRLVK